MGKPRGGWRVKNKLVVNTTLSRVNMEYQMGGRHYKKKGPYQIEAFLASIITTFCMKSCDLDSVIFLFGSLKPRHACLFVFGVQFRRKVKLKITSFIC